ncbi:arginyl-tRNA synthetase, mitochondrial [Lycorma delicatula]|uniref:arginyl-tRNA synthetase, mitochondrial n=1 Tax=Lycorma delicatula TaxID=130591 RepID=UPI003F512D66
MALAKYKTLIGRKVADVLKKTCNDVEINPNTVELLINLNKFIKTNNTMQLHLPLTSLQQHYKNISEEHFQKLTNLKNDSVLEGVSGSKIDNEPLILFHLNKDIFVRDTLNDNEYFSNLQTPDLNKRKYKKKVVIDFSSPNIAKPFHMGHFRSTIIGNYLSNLYEYLGYDVVRLTYLGDWGTQFGLLQVGINILGFTDKDIFQNPIECLFKAYVRANKESETDQNILSQAKDIFNSLEHGMNHSAFEKWKTIRKLTVEELKITYERLGIQFNVYDWESNYPANRSKSVINILKDKKYVTNEDGKLVFKSKCGSNVTLLKSDGSSLYLTRDIVAAIERKAAYNLDEMIYVTDFSQQEHFKTLNEILSVVDESWSDKIQHVKYGRIRGMSTRKGEVVFLKDILDEAKEKMEEKQKLSLTTKIDFAANTSDILGVSAVMINDLKQRRLRNYEFNWDSALQMKGDGGIKLQYTHCRLINLEENCNQDLPDKCDPLLLEEYEAVNLVQEIARFDEIIQSSFLKQEPYIIVNYLFKLCNAVNRAMKVLPVKSCSSHQIASQRLLLFYRARVVLNRGMKILGLKPLSKM